MKDLKEKILNNKHIKALNDVFENHEVFLVGGFLRDLFLNIQTNDFDLVVCDFPVSDFADEIVEKLGGTKVLLDSENEIYRVVLPDKITYFDIAKPLSNDIQVDIKRRDFTMNSLFFDLNRGGIINSEAILDIKNKIIKTHSIENIEDDPLRILRAFRFMALSNFQIDKNILDFIEKNGALISNVAKERINYELLKLLSGKYALETLYLMQKTGFLNILFPIFDEIDKIPKNSHHHLPLTFHSLEIVGFIPANKPLLRLAALLHDVGKPSCWTIEQDTGRHRFLKHEEIGEKIVRKLLKNLKFSKKQIDYVSKMVKYHIYPSAIMCSKDVTSSAKLRFVKRLYPDVLDVIELARADRLTARGVAVDEKMVNENLSNLQNLKDYYFMIEPTLKELPKLLDGFEIMEILNLKQGKALGVVISQLKDAQIEGIVKNKDEAIDFIKNLKLPD